jgi:hypothetical protein
MEKYAGTREATDDNTIWCIRFACWVSRATRAHAHVHANAPANPYVITRWRARAHTHTHTHTQKYVIFLFFHGNNGFVNATQCYFIRTLRLLFSLEKQETIVKSSFFWYVKQKSDYLNHATGGSLKSRSWVLRWTILRVVTAPRINRNCVHALLYAVCTRQWPFARCISEIHRWLCTLYISPEMSCLPVRTESVVCRILHGIWTSDFIHIYTASRSVSLHSSCSCCTFARHEWVGTFTNLELHRKSCCRREHRDNRDANCLIPRTVNLAWRLASVSSLVRR